MGRKLGWMWKGFFLWFLGIWGLTNDPQHTLIFSHYVSKKTKIKENFSHWFFKFMGVVYWLMPNAFPIWHISYRLSPLLKIIHHFRIPTQKSLVPSKNLKNHMEQVFEHKGKIIEQTRTVPEQSPYTALSKPEQFPNSPRTSPNNPRTNIGQYFLDY